MIKKKIVQCRDNFRLNYFTHNVIDVSIGFLMNSKGIFSNNEIENFVARIAKINTSIITVLRDV